MEDASSTSLPKMLAIVHHLAGMAKRGRPKKNPAPQSNQKTAQQSAQSSRGEMEMFERMKLRIAIWDLNHKQGEALQSRVD